MFRILIVEDDDVQRAAVEACVRERFGARAEIFVCGDAEHADICREPDIALLDIELPAESGLALGKRLNETAPRCRIIYLTAHSEYIMSAYRTRHIWYVLKDGAQQYLPEALAAAERELERAEKNFVVHQRQRDVLVPYGEIEYFERSYRVTHVYAAGQNYVCREPLGEIQRILNDRRFARCHNSFLINLECVRELSRTNILLASGKELPVSRKFQASIRDDLGRFIGERAGGVCAVEDGA